MTIRSRIEAFQGAEIMLFGDSLKAPLFDPYGCAYVLPTLLAAKDPNARVVLHTLGPNTGNPALIPPIIIQPGSVVPSQPINFYRDALSGAGAVDRWANNYYSLNWSPLHYVSIALGVNDAGQFGTAGHSSDDFTNAMWQLINKARVTAGASQVTLTTPAWYEIGFGDPLSAPCAAIAANVRYMARKNNCACIDLRTLAEDHYTGTGNAGQGIGANAWFPTAGDKSHYGPFLHAFEAAEHMKVMGWL